MIPRGLRDGLEDYEVTKDEDELLVLIRDDRLVKITIKPVSFAKGAGWQARFHVGTEPYGRKYPETSVADVNPAEFITRVRETAREL